jgi:hypothetical protein
LVQFAVNNSWQETIQSTPFLLNTDFSHPAVPSIAPIHADLPAPGASELAKQIHAALQRAQRCMQAAQQRQKVYADQHRRHEVFKPGDLVLLQAKNFRFAAVGTRKLFPKFVGLFLLSK